MSTDNIIYDGDTVVDLSGDTVTPDSLLEGVTAHDASGTQIVGTNQGASGSVLYAAAQELSDDQKAQARDNIDAKSKGWMPTAEDVGARPNNWMPTAEDVGARPSTWTPSASDVGARPDNWMPTASDVGARPNNWTPSADDVGALPKSVDSIHPIGSIYISTSSTSPASIFGGGWERLEDTFLMAAGATYEAGTTGGSATHAHTLNSSNAHATISISSSNNALHVGLVDNINGESFTSTNSYSGMTHSSTTTAKFSARSLGVFGRTQSGDSLPPYLAIYVWKRVS